MNWAVCADAPGRCLKLPLHLAPFSKALFGKYLRHISNALHYLKQSRFQNFSLFQIDRSKYDEAHWLRLHLALVVDRSPEEPRLINNTNIFVGIAKSSHCLSVCLLIILRKHQYQWWLLQISRFSFFLDNLLMRRQKIIKVLMDKPNGEFPFHLGVDGFA